MTQTIITAIIVAIATLYVGRRIFLRLYSKNSKISDCGCGCSGNCCECSETTAKKED